MTAVRWGWPALSALCTAWVVLLSRPMKADGRSRAVASVRPDAMTVNTAADVALGGHRVAALLDLIAAALEVGLAPVAALAEVAVGVPEPARSRLRRAVAMVEIGGDATAVWRLLGDDPVLGPVAHALERSERSGAPVATVVRGLADETRREVRAERLANARRVGVRTAAPLGACFLPAFFLIAIVPTVIALVRGVL